MKEYPKNFIYGRKFRVKLKNKHVSPSFLNVWFYQFGLKALENGKLTIKHINSFTRLIKRKFKKELKFRLNVSLITPVTKKPKEVRMGKGKGQRSHWEGNIKKGMIIMEVGGIIKSKDKLFKTLKLVREKLPVDTSIVKLIF